MEKFIKALAAALVVLIASGGCTRKDTQEKPGDKARFKVLCSFLPIWAFTANVAGERPGVEVSVLIPGSQGPHDYQLTPGDMRRVGSADLFIVNGLGLEEFLENAIRKARPELTIVEAAKAVLPLHVGEAGYWEMGHDDHEHGESNINPHAFASPRDAAKMVIAIGEAMAKADPSGADVYRANAKAYAARLNALADELKAVVQAASNKKVVTFHNAFDYLARDTGLEIVGVIESAPGQSPSAGELSDLVKKVRETGAAAVFSEPQYSPRLARTLAEEAGVPVYQLDPASTGDLSKDVYEKAMRNNLETLKKALGG